MQEAIAEAHQSGVSSGTICEQERECVMSMYSTHDANCVQCPHRGEVSATSAQLYLE